MDEIFPEPIRKLPEADIPLPGIKAYLSQSGHHQILFMQFANNVDLPEHAHAAQIGFVLEGKKQSYTKADRYYIPADVKHSAKIYADYADITFFDEASRYSAKE